MRRGLGVVLLSGVGGNSILMKGRTTACLGERASELLEEQGGAVHQLWSTSLGW